MCLTVVHARRENNSFDYKFVVYHRKRVVTTFGVNLVHFLRIRLITVMTRS